MGEERGGGGGRGSSAPSGVASAVGGMLPQNAGDAELCILYLTRIHNASQWLNLHARPGAHAQTSEATARRESGHPHPCVCVRRRCGGKKRERSQEVSNSAWRKEKEEERNTDAKGMVP